MILRAAFILALGTVAANAATLTADSPALADVQAKVTLAVEGDTVAVPAGSATWASTLTIDKAITVQGAGVTTIITGAATVFTIVAPAGKTVTLEQFQIKRSTTTGDDVLVSSGGTTASSRLNAFHLDHLRFAGATHGGYSLHVKSGYGLIDHCHWTNEFRGETIMIEDLTLDGTLYGDGSWASTSATGVHLDQAVYLEDNVFDVTQFSVDARGGARYVARHNLYAASNINNHGGLDSSGRTRGCLSYDAYNNIVQAYTGVGGSVAAANSRGGNGHIFSNYALGNYNQFLTLQSYRLGGPPENTGGWLGADGLNPWDENDRAAHNGVNPVGTTCNGPPITNAPCVPSDTRLGAVYASGTLASGTNLTYGQTITLSGLPAGTDLWKFFTLINTSMTRDKDHRSFALIDTSSGNNVTVAFAGRGTNPDFTISAGDGWEIRKVIRNIDGVGLGSDGALLVSGNGGSQVLVSTGAPGWPNQAERGVFLWNNKTAVPGTATTTSNWNNSGVSTLASFDPDSVGNKPTCGAAGTLAPVLVDRDVFNRAPTGSDPGGDYNWDSGTSSVVGPDDDALTFAGATTGQSFTITGTGGYTYPHPLAGSSSGKIILLSGNMNFGNAIIGDTPLTSTLTVSNQGDADLTVTSVGYTPSQFTGSTSGFTVAAGASHDIAVTFTPDSEADFSGTITVNSDATGGTNTIAVSGHGVQGPNQRVYGAFRKMKQLLARFLP